MFTWVLWAEIRGCVAAHKLALSGVLCVYLIHDGRYKEEQ